MKPATRKIISALLAAVSFPTRHLLLALLLTLPLLLPLGGCHEAPEYNDDPYGNFDALADIVGSRYCFFREKNIDWPALCAEYRAKIKPDTRQLELFQICAELLDRLEDGHVNLASRFDTSYYRKWWTDYPQDFNLRTLQQYYLGFDYMQTTGISYKLLDEDIAYMYYPSFSTPVNATNLDYIMAVISGSKGLIIDIRDNGGGLLSNIGTFVGRFITEKTLGGYIRHKTGPEADRFSDPYPVEYDPAGEGRVNYLDRPIILLTNRSCFSAANDFVSVMKTLPQVTVAGARTGGGGGLPFSSELPNGWSVRFSACPITDSKDRPTEFGIDPSPGCEVHCTDAELAAGTDAILDFAIRLMKSKIPAKPEKSAQSPA